MGGGDRGRDSERGPARVAKRGMERHIQRDRETEKKKTGIVKERERERERTLGVKNKLDHGDTVGGDQVAVPFPQLKRPPPRLTKRVFWRSRDIFDHIVCLAGELGTVALSQLLNGSRIS